MEDLNRHQLLLLTVLVSFVTSLATGIATVSLMEKAPPIVTQTVSRIIERTVETVVPGETRVETVVREASTAATEEDFIVAAVKTGEAGTVRIATPDGTLLGSGFLATPAGVVATVDSVLGFGDGAAEKSNFVVFFAGTGGKSHPARLLHRDRSGVVLLKLDLGGVGDIGLSAEFKDEKRLVAVLSTAEGGRAAGQTVLALGLTAAGELSVSRGIISSLSPAATSSPDLIRTPAVDAVNLGGPLLNLKGQVVGLNKVEGVALGIKFLREALAAVAT